MTSGGDMRSNFIHAFHIGPEKTASTWLYLCMREHPELCVPHRDKTHYYNMFHHKGIEWLREQYMEGFDELVVVDPTPAYLHSLKAPERIARENPDAKIIVTLRHPVERAFSHYWQSKKKRAHNYEFGDILDRYLLFKGWLEPGFYADHLERWMTYFPRERIKAFVFDDFSEQAELAVHDLFAFIGVDADFSPDSLHAKVNVARPRSSTFAHAVKRNLRAAGLDGVTRRTSSLARKFGLWDRTKGRDIERLEDVSPAIRGELDVIVEPEIERLERLLDIDLSRWRKS